MTREFAGRHASVVGGLALLAITLLAGCAGTAVGHFGPVRPGHPLVTLVVTEDMEIVARECARVAAEGRMLGCQLSWPVAGDRPYRAVKIVRYTDRLPSDMAFEIDGHELCHMVAALQLLDDPCHRDNNGVLQARMPRR